MAAAFLGRVGPGALVKSRPFLAGGPAAPLGKIPRTPNQPVSCCPRGDLPVIGAAFPASAPGRSASRCRLLELRGGESAGRPPRLASSRLPWRGEGLGLRPGRAQFLLELTAGRPSRPLARELGKQHPAGDGLLFRTGAASLFFLPRRLLRSDPRPPHSHPMELEGQWWKGQLAADIHQALRYKVSRPGHPAPSLRRPTPILGVRGPAEEADRAPRAQVLPYGCSGCPPTPKPRRFGSVVLISCGGKGPLSGLSNPPFLNFLCFPPPLF